MKNSWRELRMVHSIKYLLKASYASIGIFLSFFVLFYIGNSFYVSYISDRELKSFRDGITQDESYLKTQGDLVSQNPDLIINMVQKNKTDLLNLLNKEKADRSIGLLSVTSAQGVIMGRTIDPTRFGDNVFLTAPAGRRVAQGESVQSIELTGFYGQIFMTTARPIMSQDSMIGGLFANYLMNDSYAVRFKKAYLRSDSEVVFYTKNHGVYGGSFTGKNARQLVGSYFNTGSDWIKDGVSGKTVYFNGNSYYIVNVIFHGLDESPGGALVFIPRKDLSDTAYGVMAIFAFLLFVFLAYSRHARLRNEERTWRYSVVLFTFATVIMGIVFIFAHIKDSSQIQLKAIPFPLYNSVIELEPDFGIYEAGFSQSFFIVVDTGDEKINAVQTKLIFDPLNVHIKSIDSGTSTCQYVIENKIDNKEGTAHFSCVILDKEAGRKKIPVAKVTIEPLKTGVINLSFDQSETKVLASDGLGTNVLRAFQNGSYRFDNFNIDINSETSTTSKGRSFIVFSTTHPNESRWYNSPNAHFVWRGKADATYRYSFDTIPNTVPTNEHTLRGSQIDIPLLGDGVHYFHLQLASGGPIAHYSVRSDMTAPEISTMNLSENKVSVGDVLRLSFAAKDLASGVEKNYYVDLGNHLFLPTGSDLWVPFLEAGLKTITLRVYDNAGNYAEETRTVQVETASR